MIAASSRGSDGFRVCGGGGRAVQDRVRDDAGGRAREGAARPVAIS